MTPFFSSSAGAFLARYPKYWKIPQKPVKLDKNIEKTENGSIIWNLLGSINKNIFIYITVY